MLELTHYDDGKQKYQSHEVYMMDKDGSMLYDVDFSDIYGYGETYEEALEEFKKAFDEKFKKLTAFRQLLFETDKLIPVEVDCCGKPVKVKD